MILLQNSHYLWLWSLYSSKNFTFMSLVEDLGGTMDSILKYIYSIIWKDAYPKKIKIFLWELNHGAINTSLQQQMLYFLLSPSWCIMCKSNVECPSHLFVHCSFATQFWHIILEAFSWFVTFPSLGETSFFMNLGSVFFFLFFFFCKANLGRFYGCLSFHSSFFSESFGLKGTTALSGTFFFPVIVFGN